MGETSFLALMGRLTVSFAVVLVLMLVVAKVLRRRSLGTGGSPASRIEVLSRQALGRSSSVQLVRVAGRTLVLGVTDASVRVLGEADPLLLEAEQLLETPPAGSAPPRPGWGPLLEVLKDRTART